MLGLINNTAKKYVLLLHQVCNQNNLVNKLIYFTKFNDKFRHYVLNPSCGLKIELFLSKNIFVRSAHSFVTISPKFFKIKIKMQGTV